MTQFISKIMKKTFFVAAFFLLTSIVSFAQSADEKAVGDAVEKLRKAIVDADGATLTKLTSPLLSYGHSNGNAGRSKRIYSCYHER